MFITPEFSLIGYPPGDLIFRDDFMTKIELYKKKILEISRNTKTILVLSIPQKKKQIYNSLLLIKSGKIIKQFFKKNLPNYGVFDEKRYFSVNKEFTNNIFKLKNKNIKFLICEDMWGKDHFRKNEKVDLIISINASPFELGKDKKRKKIAKENARFFRSKVLYLNSVGAQDDLVFDGGSFLMNGSGEIEYQEEYFKESSRIISTDKINSNIIRPEENELIFNALCVSLKSYVKKNNFNSVIIGLSGGIDSALCLAIASTTLGSKNVIPFYLPTIFSSEDSKKDATQLCRNYGIELNEISIEKMRIELLNLLSPFFKKFPNDITEENIQSRFRGLILMALSNKTNSLLIATGNKSEYSVGYSTLYGDMCGGFALLKDLYKTKVYDLCNWINNKQSCFDKKIQQIPVNIINKEPTAELKFEQKDSDSLPPYEVLDKILELLIDKNEDLKSIIDLGYKKNQVKMIWNLIKKSEFKRYQSALGPKLTKMSLANDRRFPVTNKFEL